MKVLNPINTRLFSGPRPPPKKEPTASYQLPDNPYLRAKSNTDGGIGSNCRKPQDHFKLDTPGGGGSGSAGAELLAAGSAESKLPPPQLEPGREYQTRAGSNDLSALTALSGQGEEPGGQEIVVATNVEDMEASFHTESRPGNSYAEGETVDSQACSAGGPPPGFGGQQQLQGILGQTGSRVRHATAMHTAPATGRT